MIKLNLIVSKDSFFPFSVASNTKEESSETSEMDTSGEVGNCHCHIK